MISKKASERLLERLKSLPFNLLTPAGIPDMLRGHMRVSTASGDGIGRRAGFLESCN